MTKDINKNNYDEATLTKLDIFEQYLIAWLPVFIQTPHTSEVTICDFFAGSGQDAGGTPGSPQRILNTIEKYKDDIFQKNIKINVILNELLPEKFNELKNTISEKYDLKLWEHRVNVEYQKKDFQILFKELYPRLQMQPNLLFIDQYGIKQVNSITFKMLIDLKKTDFLFFISSSHIKRFINTPEFKLYFPDFGLKETENLKYEDIHRVILDYYKRKITSGNDTKLYPFTLKKGTNIYGLIFGSKHPLGVEKFLNLAWNKNFINGEANFDIDADIKKQTRGLFDNQPGYEKPKTKKEIFEIKLEMFITENNQVTNLDVYNFALNMGHPGTHAQECVKKLRMAGKLECDAKIGFTYNTCIKKRIIKTIKAKNNG